MASDAQIDQCLAALEVVYPNHFKSWTTLNQLKMARAIYHRIWSDIDSALLEAATMQWLSTKHPFHPSPGELRDLALSLVTRNEPSADEAWIEVLAAIRYPGSWGTPTWSNERIANTVKAFGWIELAQHDIDQRGIVRAQFMKIYEAQRMREHDDRLMLPETRAAVQQRIAQLAEQKRIGAGK